MSVMVDEERGHRFARIVDHKGLGECGENEWLVLDAAADIRSWGDVEGGELILKSDDETAILAVRDTLGRYLGGAGTPENTRLTNPPPMVRRRRRGKPCGRS